MPMHLRMTWKPLERDARAPAAPRTANTGTLNGSPCETNAMAVTQEPRAIDYRQSKSG
jgi:hypothetical protein